MDRPIIYPQEQVRTYDPLSGSVAQLLAVSNLAADLGIPSPSIAGWAPTYNSNLTVTLGAGRIYVNAEVDNSAYSVLAQNTSTILQQGQNSGETLTFTTAALVSGQSQWALVEVEYAQADVVPANDPTSGVLTYANPANPTQPYVGPNNAGTAQPTLRQAQANLQIIYGTPATSGSETAPAVSSGYTPMYLVHLTFGQTIITSANLFVAGPAATPNPPSYTAPFLAIDPTLRTALASEASPDGASLVGFLQSGTGAVGQTLDAWLKKRPISVTDYGADPTGVLDSTAEINNAAIEAALVGRLLTGTGTFLISGTITIKSSCDFRGATFNVSGNPTIAVDINAGLSANISSQTFYLPNINNLSKPSVGWAGCGTGVRDVNLVECSIYVQSITDFAIGYQEAGYNAMGHFDNTYYLTRLQNNQINQQIYTDSATNGWVNQNAHFGGSFTHVTGELSGGVTAGIVTAGGAGFTSGTYTLGVSGGAGTGCTGTYTCSGGVVASIAITAAGSGYTYSSGPVFTFPSGGGTGAAGVPSLAVIGTRHIQITNQTGAAGVANGHNWFGPDLESPSVVEYAVDSYGVGCNTYSPRFEYTTGINRVWYRNDTVTIGLKGSQNLLMYGDANEYGSNVLIIQDTYADRNHLFTVDHIVLEGANANPIISLSNRAGDTIPVLATVPAGTDMYATSLGSTSYSSAISVANALKSKAFADAFDRIYTANATGQLFFGTGSAAATMYIYAAGQSTLRISAPVVDFSALTTAVTATAGTATLPANPLGFFDLSVGGVSVKVPYYSP